MRLSYSTPQIAVFLRRLAYEQYVAGKSISVNDAVSDYVQQVRRELGLKEYRPRETSGGADAFVQQRYKGKDICKEDGELKLCDKQWQSEWRLLRLPSHELVRRLSVAPVIEDKSPNPPTYHQAALRFREPAIPILEVFAGTGDVLCKECGNLRGIYFLGSDQSLYIGKTDEFETRWRFHGEKNSTWVVFASVFENPASFTSDALGASEGLLISLWNEVAIVSNRNRGTDRMPGSPYLQQAISFIEGASAALLWLARGKIASVDIPFKRWSGQADWPDCYMQAPQKA